MGVDVGQVQDTIIHHSANAAAITIPLLASIAMHIQTWVVYGPSVLGMIWYLILIAERIDGWWERVKKWRVSKK